MTVLDTELKANTEPSTERYIKLTGFVKPLDVIIPCHNYGHYLSECVYSVLDSKGFSTKVSTITIVDDWSTDNTSEIGIGLSNLYPYVVRYLHCEFRNVHKARSFGYANTKAEIICFLDADDAVNPDYFIAGLPLFNDEKVGIVYSDMAHYNEKDEYIDAWVQPEYEPSRQYEELKVKNYIGAGSLVRRTALRQSGVMYRDLPPDVHQTHADWWMFKSVVKLGWVAKKQRAVYRYRIHADSMMQTYLREMEGKGD